MNTFTPVTPAMECSQHRSQYTLVRANPLTQAAIDYAEDEWDWVPLSPEAIAALEAGVERAKNEPLVYRESFAQYAEDE